MKKVRLISLDLETSGLDPARHRPLTIGAVDIETGEDYYVGLEWDELAVSVQAMRVNRIDLTASNRTQDWHLCRDLSRTFPAAEAIAEFGQWLSIRRKADEELRALGKNPGSFDLPLLRPTWDEFWGYHAIFRGFPFSYRCVDLNSAFAAIACARGLDIENVRGDIMERAWRDFRQSAEKTNYKGSLAELFRELDAAGGAEHHALGDAWWNVFAWRCCLDMIRGEE